jgi:AAA+ superfamily predicted ATPase
MTANRLDQLPVEFVSRVDDRFFFDLPNDQERLDIIKIHLKDILGLSVEDLKSWNLKLLVTASSGMTSREIVQSILSAMRSSYAKGRVIMTVDHLKKVMLAKPLLATTMSMEVEALRSWVGVDKSGRGTKAMLATPRPERKLRSI